MRTQRSRPAGGSRPAACGGLAPCAWTSVRLRMASRVRLATFITVGFLVLCVLVLPRISGALAYPLIDPGQPPDVSLRPRLHSYHVQAPPGRNIPLGFNVPVLMYHHVAPDPSRAGLGLRVRPVDFDAQMNYLFQNGYRTVRLQDLAAAIQGIGHALPPKPVVITFDDGYEDVYRYAFPILRKYGYTATVFLVSSWLNQPEKYGALSWDQVKAMARAGMQFGSHTVSHPNLLKLSLRDALEEMTESRAAIEATLGCL